MDDLLCEQISPNSRFSKVYFAPSQDLKLFKLIFPFSYFSLFVICPSSIFPVTELNK